MPVIDRKPHCTLETWDTRGKTWVPDPAVYPSVAAATAAAAERGVYRVVLVTHGRSLEVDVFAIV